MSIASTPKFGPMTKHMIGDVIMHHRGIGYSEAWAGLATPVYVGGDLGHVDGDELAAAKAWTYATGREHKLWAQPGVVATKEPTYYRGRDHAIRNFGTEEAAVRAIRSGIIA